MPQPLMKSVVKLLWHIKFESLTLLMYGYASFCSVRQRTGLGRASTAVVIPERSCCTGRVSAIANANENANANASDFQLTSDPTAEP
jgi:hypothetical protein